MKRTLLAAVVAAVVATAPCFAEPIDSRTSCSVAALAASAVANCRLHPRRSIHNAADFVYRSVRDIQIQLGVAK